MHIGPGQLSVLFHIQLRAHIFEALHHVFAELIIVFADARGEHDRIHAVHGGGVSADILANAVDQHIPGQLRPLVARLGGVIHIAHIVGNAADAQQTALFIADIQHFADGEMLVIADIFHHSGVHAARAGAHNHALQRRDAHGGIHALAVIHRAQRGAVAQMASDNAQLLGLLAQEFGGALAHKAVGGAVEAVAAHMQLFIIFVGHAVHIGLGGHGLVEGGVEHGHHGGAGHYLLAGLDAHQVGGVVQGAQGNIFLDSVQNGLIDDNGFGEFAAAVEHAMAHRADLAHFLHHAEGFIRQRVQHHMAGLHMVFNGRFFPIHHLLAANFAFVMALGAHADAFHQALGQGAFILHIDQLIFQRGGTGVNDQDFHLRFLLSSASREFSGIYYTGHSLFWQGKKEKLSLLYCVSKAGRRISSPRPFQMFGLSLTLHFRPAFSAVCFNSAISSSRGGRKSSWAYFSPTKEYFAPAN